MSSLEDITKMCDGAQLRHQAQNLIDQALKNDGLKPRLVIHQTHNGATSIHLIWSATPLTVEDVLARVSPELDEDRENIEIVNDPDFYGELAGFNASALDVLPY